MARYHRSAAAGVAAPKEIALPEERVEQVRKLLVRWIQIRDRNDSEAFLHEHASELLTDEAEAVLQTLKNTKYSKLLRACREHGIEAAYEQIRRATSQNPLIQGLLRFLQADSDEEARAVLLAQPELLLSDEAGEALEKFQGGDEASSAHLARRKALWQQVRQERGGLG